MDPNHHELIRTEMRTARETLRAARVLLEAGMARDAISRAYYAVFHAAKAILASRGLHAESHSGLKAMFGVHLVEPGRIDRRLGKILGELMERRESCDYDVWTPHDIEDAAGSVEDAGAFIDAAATDLRSTGIDT